MLEECPVGGGLPQVVDGCPGGWKIVLGSGELSQVVEDCLGWWSIAMEMEDCPR